MVKHYARNAFEVKYLSDCRVMCQINKHNLLPLTPDGKEWKTNIGDVKPCTMAVLKEWHGILLYYLFIIIH